MGVYIKRVPLLLVLLNQRRFHHPFSRSITCPTVKSQKKEDWWSNTFSFDVGGTFEFWIALHEFLYKKVFVVNFLIEYYSPHQYFLKLLPLRSLSHAAAALPSPLQDLLPTQNPGLLTLETSRRRRGPPFGRRNLGVGVRFLEESKRERTWE